MDMLVCDSLAGEHNDMDYRSKVFQKEYIKLCYHKIIKLHFFQPW